MRSLFLLLLLVGCGPSGTPCESSLNCEMDEVCRNSTCQPRGCLSSTDCAIQQYCDDSTGSCVEGCQLDRDCLPDEVCDEGSCVVAACRDTNLDCSFGQFCNGITGDCFDAGGFYCQDCSGQGQDACGGAQNFCVSIGGAGPYCGVDCSLGQECPRGYDCVPIIDAGQNIIGRNCITACWMME